MKQNKIPRNEYIVKPKGKTDPYKDDVQYTNLGQWKYPGQVTKIPGTAYGTQITMDNVPYHVYGEDNLGYGQMMYPGMDYTFPGQYVTEIPMAQDGIEHKVNKWLGEPMKKAQEASKGDKWFNPKTKQWEQEDDVDNYRHPMAGMYTSQAIANKFPSWMQYTGIPQAAGFLGANALGVAHEVTNPNSDPNYSWWDVVREAGEDIFNNAVGAGVGTLPISDDKKSDILWNLSKNNKLPDGYAKANMYFKAYGGDPSLPNITGHYQKGGGYHPEYYDYRLASGEKYPIVYKDIRKIPQSGVVVDKRTNMAYAVGDDGKTLSFNVLTGANPNLNVNPYTLEQLAQNKKLRATPVGYYNMTKQEASSKGSPDDVNYKGKIRYLDPITAYGQGAPSAVDLAFHRVYADNAYDPADSSYNKRLELLRQADPKLRCGSYGCVNVGDNSYDKINKMFPNPDTLMVIDSKRPNDLKLLKQVKKKMKKQEGGEWLNDLEDEFKRGGQKGLKRFTSKNIQTSINDIMLRNETLFGPPGKRRYKPNLKYQDGGESTNWLDDI